MIAKKSTFVADDSPLSILIYIPIIKNLKSTPEIKNAFEYLPKIENVFKKKNESRQNRFKLSSQNLFDHLMAVAVQEQRNILQELVWKDWKVQAQATLQSVTDLPDSTLVLSSDYGVNAVKPDKNGNYKGRHAGAINKLPESVYSKPFSHTKVQDYDSRMEWIKKAAEKYHLLMLSDTGRPFLEKELAIIAGWGKSQADFKVGKDSNDGKI